MLREHNFGESDSLRNAAFLLTFCRLVKKRRGFSATYVVLDYHLDSLRLGPMAGKQAKTLSQDDLSLVLTSLTTTRHPIRNRVILLLSVKAGLRAAEISKLDWSMVLGPSGEVGWTIELRDQIAKTRGGRVIPMHPMLRDALRAWRLECGATEGPVVRSERGGPRSVSAISSKHSTERSVWKAAHRIVDEGRSLPKRLGP
jgi:integrase